MATSQKITSKEIYQKDLFENMNKSAAETTATLSQLEKGLIDIAKLTKKALTQGDDKSAKGIKDLNNAIAESKKLETALNQIKAAQLKLDKERAAFEAKRQKTQASQKTLTDKEIKQAEVRRILEKQRIATLKALAIEESKQLGTELKLQAANTRLRIERDKLNESDANYASELKRINGLIDENNAKINANADQLKQQKINVGNYTRSIHAAINETGIFNSTLGNLLISIRGLIVSQDAAATGARRFSNILKASGVGLIIAGIAGITAAVKASQGALDQISVTVGKLKDFGVELYNDFITRFMPAILASGQKVESNYEDTAKAVIKLREETLKYRLELQALTLDEEDLRDRSNDTTLGFKARNKAEKEANDLKKKIVDLNVVQAQKELDILKHQVFLNGKNADDLEKENEAQLKLNEALDAQSDLVNIDIPLGLRKRKAEELAFEVDLLIGKKTSATAQLTILENQAKDEKGIIDERKKALLDLEKEITTNFNLGLDTFNKYSNVQITQKKALELAALTSKEELSKELIALELNVAETETLAKIIVKFQNQRVENAATNQDILKDEIELNQRLAEITRDILNLKRDDAILDEEIRLKSTQAATAKLEAEFFAGNIFNRKKLDALIEQKDAENQIEDSILAKRRANLVQDAKDLEQKIKDKGLAKEEETAEILRIEEKLQIDLENLDEEGQRLQRERREKNLLFFKDLNKKESLIVLDELAKVSQATEQELDKRTTKQQAAFEKELELREKTIQRQNDLAAQGLDNELAFQESQQAKTELKQKDALEKAAKTKETIQLTEAYFNAFNARLSVAGANPLLASSQALGDVLKARGVAKGIVQFAKEGNDMVMPNGQGGREGVDDIPFLLTKHEGVVKADANLENSGVVESLNNDTFSKLYIPRSQFNQEAAKLKERAADDYLNKQFEKQTKLLEDIANKPVQQIDVDNLKGFIETIFDKKGKTTITHKMRL